MKKKQSNQLRLFAASASSLVLIIALLSSSLRVTNAETNAVSIKVDASNATPTLTKNHSIKVDHFAACLLTMDDNYRMIEWLAYHYHTLPLRRLILLVDPRSKTSPFPILERWRDYMEIDVWEDSDIFTDEQLRDRSEEGLIFLHRARQRAFNVKCMNTLRDEGAKWTLMTDVDEYLYINPRVWDSSDNLFQKEISPISIEHSGSVLTMLNELDMDDERTHSLEWKACLPVARLQFGGVESLPNEVENRFPKDLAPTLQANDFDTFRWRHYGTDSTTARNGVIPGKTIIDLSMVPEEEVRRFMGDPHRPIDKLCNGGNVWLEESETIFIANHVLGTVEQFASRDDARLVDRILNWKKRKSVSGNISDAVRPWLAGFVEEMGMNEARRLLASVGQVQNKSPPRLPRCSINLFGLPRSFRIMTLPSLVKNVLLPNARYNCDIFVHYYKIDHEDTGRFNVGGEIDFDSIYELKAVVEMIAANGGKSPPTVVIKGETKEEFSAKYGNLVEYYQTARGEDEKLIYFPWADKSYTSPKQIENIVMQWNSIQSVWNEMEKNSNKLGFQYERVACLRIDAFYALPLDIFQVDKDTYDYANRYAVIPGFAKYPVNDRMIYGPTEAVKIWATERFTRLDDHIDLNGQVGYGMHSERFIGYEIVPSITKETGYEVIENEDICFYRTRAENSVLVTDCSDTKGGSTRGIEVIDQKALVEDLVQRECEENPLDVSRRFVELRCGLHGAVGYAAKARRHLTGESLTISPTIPPTFPPTPSPTISPSKVSSSEVLMICNGHDR